MARLQMVDLEGSKAVPLHIMLVGLGTLEYFLLEMIDADEIPAPGMVPSRDHLFVLDFEQVSCMRWDMKRAQQEILTIFRRMLWETPHFCIRGALDEGEAARTKLAINNRRWHSWRDFVDELNALRLIGRRALLDRKFLTAESAFIDCEAMLWCAHGTRQYGEFHKDKHLNEFSDLQLRYKCSLSIDKSLAKLALAEIYEDLREPCALKALQKANSCFRRGKQLLDGEFDFPQVESRMKKLLVDTNDMKLGSPARTQERLDVTREIIRLAANVLLKDDTILSDLDVVERETRARRTLSQT